jgi:hypothetical protein
MGIIPLATAKKNKKNLKLLYDILFTPEPETAAPETAVADTKTAEEEKVFVSNCFKKALVAVAEEDTKYTCECCGYCDKEEVGLATGLNGVDMRVCDMCDIDGSNYNGWGDN